MAIKSAIAEWESRSTAVKLMIRSMVRSKIDMNAAAANRAKREEKKREKNELAAKKRQEKEDAERAKREQKDALERAKQASKPVALRPPQGLVHLQLEAHSQPGDDLLRHCRAIVQRARQGKLCEALRISDGRSK